MRLTQASSLGRMSPHNPSVANLFPKHQHQQQSTDGAERARAVSTSQPGEQPGSPSRDVALDGSRRSGQRAGRGRGSGNGVHHNPQPHAHMHGRSHIDAINEQGPPLPPALMAVLGGKSRSEQGMLAAAGGAGGSPGGPSGGGGSGGGSPANNQLANALPGTSPGSGDSRGGSRGGSRANSRGGSPSTSGNVAGLVAASGIGPTASPLGRPPQPSKSSSQPALPLPLPLALSGGGSTGGGLGSGRRREGSGSSISVMFSRNDSRDGKDGSSRPADAAGGAFTGGTSDSLVHPTLAGGVVSAGGGGAGSGGILAAGGMVDSPRSGPSGVRPMDLDQEPTVQASRSVHLCGCACGTSETLCT